MIAAQLEAIKAARTAVVRIADQTAATVLSSTRLFNWSTGRRA